MWCIGKRKPISTDAEQCKLQYSLLSSDSHKLKIEFPIFGHDAACSAFALSHKTRTKALNSAIPAHGAKPGHLRVPRACVADAYSNLETYVRCNGKHEQLSWLALIQIIRLITT
jgi:hypothetical protein